MFDEPPANLPVAAASPAAGPTPPPLPASAVPPYAGLPPASPIQIKTPNLGNRAAASVPKPPAPSPAPAPMTGGIRLPKKQEPEDIFGDLEKAAAEPGGPSVEGLREEKPSGGAMRWVIYGLAGLVIVAVLVIGGFFFYSRFIAPTPAVPTPAAPPAAPPTTPTVPPSDGVPSPVPSAEPTPAPTTEAPPTVPPTPPPNVPPPAPVQQLVDTDGDGLTDEQEATLGTNAQAADTDGDGLTDGEEVNAYKTSPLIADTDGDGLTDGDEVKVWKTDPNKPDTDGDGYSDGQEVQNGFNPNGPGRLPAPGASTP